MSDSEGISHVCGTPTEVYYSLKTEYNQYSDASYANSGYAEGSYTGTLVLGDNVSRGSNYLVATYLEKDIPLVQVDVADLCESSDVEFGIEPNDDSTYATIIIPSDSVTYYFPDAYTYSGCGFMERSIVAKHDGNQIALNELPAWISISDDMRSVTYTSVAGEAYETTYSFDVNFELTYGRESGAFLEYQHSDSITLHFGTDLCKMNNYAHIIWESELFTQDSYGRGNPEQHYALPVIADHLSEITGYTMCHFEVAVIVTYEDDTVVDPAIYPDLSYIDWNTNMLVIASEEDAPFADGSYRIDLSYKLEGTADGEFPEMEIHIENFMYLYIGHRCDMTTIELVYLEPSSAGYTLWCATCGLSSTESYSPEKTQYLMDGTTVDYTLPIGVDYQTYLLYADTGAVVTPDDFICGETVISETSIHQIDAAGVSVAEYGLEDVASFFSIDQTTLSVSVVAGDLQSGAYTFEGQYSLVDYDHISTHFEFFGVVLGGACLANNEIVTIDEGDNGGYAYVPVGEVETVRIAYPESRDATSLYNNEDCGTVENRVHLYRDGVFVEAADYPSCINTNIDENG